MNRPARTPGICRIDQPEKHNHGFFVRLQRQGRIYSAFFTDLKYGGQAAALAAAQRFYRQSVAIFGPPARLKRQWWAQTVRRKGRSGIPGVQEAVVRRKFFSIRKYGAWEAKLLAIRARRAGVRSMKP
jgi:hypothetical protein